MSNNLKLDEASLEFLLNFILNNLKEDREMALQHHDTLAGLLQGPPGSEGMSALDVQLLLNEVSTAVKNFMQSAATSTEQAIKIAKILSDILVKSDPAESLTDDERADLQRMLEEEKEAYKKAENILDLNSAIGNDNGS